MKEILKLIDSINNNKSHPYLYEPDKAEGYFYALRKLKEIIKKYDNENNRRNK